MSHGSYSKEKNNDILSVSDVLFGCFPFLSWRTTINTDHGRSRSISIVKAGVASSLKSWQLLWQWCLSSQLLSHCYLSSSFSICFPTILAKSIVRNKYSAGVLARTGAVLDYHVWVLSSRVLCLRALCRVLCQVLAEEGVEYFDSRAISIWFQPLCCWTPPTIYWTLDMQCMYQCNCSIDTSILCIA